MAGYEGAAISADDFLANIGTYWKGATVVGGTSAPAPAPESSYAYESFSPASYYGGDSNQFFYAISGAPSAPYAPGISEAPEPLWAMGGDMETMTIDATINGGGLGIGAPAVDDSMQSRMSNAMILPSGEADWGKWVIVAGVLITLYLIGREMGRKGSPQ